MRNEIDIEFYYGAVKGAAETLRQRRGNDIDQASLLIALMRASGVPARYVRGVVALTGEAAHERCLAFGKARTDARHCGQRLTEPNEIARTGRRQGDTCC